MMKKKDEKAVMCGDPNTEGATKCILELFGVSEEILKRLSNTVLSALSPYPTCLDVAHRYGLHHQYTYDAS